MRYLWVALPSLLLAVASCGPMSNAESGEFDGQRAYQDILAQCEFGPRPPGSLALQETGNYIIASLTKVGWEVETQEFELRGVPLRNIIARKGTGPVVILGAHYDTRPYADNDAVNKNQSILGANDGASGVAVLLELARVLDIEKTRYQVWLAFFDAEDSGNLNGWPWSVGATHMAETLTVPVEFVVVVDMVGDADQQICREQYSDVALQDRIFRIAADLGYEQYFISKCMLGVIDDHWPFLMKGIPAVDLIDFQYPYWHASQDTADKVSPDSLERVGRTLEVLLEENEK